MIILLLFFIGAAILAQQKSAIGNKGMVVSVDEYASKIGIEILKKGGNAIDAAVATAFALAVSYPEAGNIGGGGFMLIRMANGESVGIDYREKAPAKAFAEMFLNSKGELDTITSEYGYLVAGVPGTVRGLETAWKKYGKLKWRELLEPAIRLAKNGFTVNKSLAFDLKDYEKDLSYFSESRKTFFRNGKTYQEGDTLILKDLSSTLQTIADKGSAGFYEGEIARKIAQDFSDHGGLVNEADLKNYQAVVRKPLQGKFGGYDILGMPPVSSGGICVIELLNILEELKLDEKPTPQNLHKMIEAMRLVFFDRARYQGDADFVEVPVEKLISKEYARERARKIDLNRAASSDSLLQNVIFRPENMHTTHFSVVDSEGNCVSNTFTLEDYFGSKAVVTGLGFLLNNEMHDFNVDPNRPTYQGGFDKNPNTIAPNKRMLSSMSPTIVLKSGKPVLITGSPGGRTIINTVTQIILNTTHYKMNLREAVDFPRINHNWIPDYARFEKTWDAKTIQLLKAKGHEIRTVDGIGDAHSIWVNPQTRRYQGEADKRHFGWAEGY